MEEGVRKRASHACQEAIRAASKVDHTSLLLCHLVPLCPRLLSFIVIVVVVGLFLPLYSDPSNSP